MLSSVLRSPAVVTVNVEIMRVFVRLRRMVASHADLARKVFRRLLALAEACRKDLGDGKREGKNCRQPGRAEDAKPLTE